MKFVKLIGWKPGLNAVALIDTVRSCVPKSLSSAKKDVERLLDGEIVVLEFDSDDSGTLFREKAQTLGATVVEFDPFNP
jgi:hypothetical protein